MKAKSKRSHASYVRAGKKAARTRARTARKGRKATVAGFPNRRKRR